MVTQASQGWNRRKVLATGAALAAMPVVAATPVLATEGVDLTGLPPLPPDVAQFDSKNVGDLNDYSPNRGTAKPSGQQEAVAKAIVAMSPTTKGGRTAFPYEIALYFLSVATDQDGTSPDNKFSKDWPGYMRAWPLGNTVPANPLISEEFFSAVKYTPVGDTTAWCSAFMNWCVKRSANPALTIKPKGNPAALSWTDYGNGITFKRGSAAPRGGVPKLGDLVVFRDVGSKVHGHVAFFKELRGDRIRFFGGNHLEGKPVRHVISEKELPLWGSVLEIHSIRQAPGLN